MHRTAVLRHDELGQETLLNLLLRNHLSANLYEQVQLLIPCMLPATLDGCRVPAACWSHQEAAQGKTWGQVQLHRLLSSRCCIATCLWCWETFGHAAPGLTINKP